LIGEGEWGYSKKVFEKEIADNQNEKSC